MALRRTNVRIIALAWTSLCCAQELPDLDALLQEVRNHEKAAYALREHYTFHEVLRIKDKTQDTSEADVFFVNGYRIDRATKRKGVELSARDNERELTRATKEARSRAKAAPAKDKFAWASEFLQEMQLSNPRREFYRSRSTLVFDFRDASRATARGAAADTPKTFGGTIWIDETDRQLAHLEMRFFDSFHAKGTGALLSLFQKGSTIVIDQSPVAEGLWMETGIDAQMGFRVLFKSFQFEVHVQDSDFRRFDTSTMQTISPPVTRPL